MISKKVRTPVLGLVPVFALLHGGMFAGQDRLVETQSEPTIALQEDSIMVSSDWDGAVEPSRDVSLDPKEVFQQGYQEDQQGSVTQDLMDICKKNTDAAVLFKDLSSAIEADDTEKFSDLYERLSQIRTLNNEEITRYVIAEDSVSCLGFLLSKELTLGSTNAAGENLIHEAAKNPYPSRCLQVLLEWIDSGMDGPVKEEDTRKNKQKKTIKGKPLKVMNQEEPEAQRQKGKKKEGSLAGLNSVQVLLEQDKDGNTPIHVAYNNKKFQEGDAMLDLIRRAAYASNPSLQPGTFDPALLITDKKGENLQECRTSNKWVQIGGLVASGVLFALMMGSTIYDALTHESGSMW